MKSFGRIRRSSITPPHSADKVRQGLALVATAALVAAAALICTKAVLEHATTSAASSSHAFQPGQRADSGPAPAALRSQDAAEAGIPQGTLAPDTDIDHDNTVAPAPDLPDEDLSGYGPPPDALSTNNSDFGGPSSNDGFLTRPGVNDPFASDMRKQPSSSGRSRSALMSSEPGGAETSRKAAGGRVSGLATVLGGG